LYALNQIIIQFVVHTIFVLSVLCCKHHVDVRDVTATADDSINVETTMRVLRIRLWPM